MGAVTLQAYEIDVVISTKVSRVGGLEFPLKHELIFLDEYRCIKKGV